MIFTETNINIRKDKQVPTCNKAGFSIIELIIVLSIVIIISTVILVNFPDFNSRIALQLEGQNVSVTIRETQVFGVAVRGETDPGSGSLVYPDYGIYLHSVLFPNELVIFGDINAETSQGYDTGTDLDIDRFSLTDQHSISDMCECRRSGRK